MPTSQSREVREMFHARFDGCLVLYLNTNFDINVNLRHKCWQTDGRKIGRLYRTLLQAGATKTKQKN